MNKSKLYNLVIAKTKKNFFLKENDILIGSWLFEKFDLDFNNEKSKICSPIFNTRSSRKKIYLECEQIYNSIFKDFVEVINNYHEINFSNRSWKLIAENWLRKFVYICFNRYETLKSAFNEFKFDKIYIKKNDKFSLYTKDSQGLYFASIEENWDSNLFYKIIKFFNFNYELVTEETEDKITNSVSHEDVVKENNMKANLKNKVLKEILNFFGFLSRKNDVVVFKTYLNFLTEKYIEISLCQFPTFFKEKFTDFENFNLDCRKKLKFKKTKDINLENFVRENLAYSLPISMIESFKNILNISGHVNFPKKPKIVFISTGFEDDILQIFIAKHSENRAKFKYIVGQHGASYFTDHDSNFRTEVNESDFFFSWGYNNYKKNIIPFFNFKTYKRKITYNNRGNLLIIFRSLGYRFEPWDRHYEVLSEINKVTKMFLLLEKSIQNNSVLRLHQSYERSDYIIKKYIKKLNCNLDFGTSGYLDLLKKTRLVCFNYDGTGFLENLLLNIPSLTLCQNVYININDEFKKKYEILFKAKLIFDDPKKMSKHIDKIWNSVDNWWFSNEVQSAIREFNKNYNIIGNKKDISRLVNFLKKNIQ